MKLLHVNRGQPVGPELRTDTWNAFVDAAVANRMQGGQKPAPKGGTQGHLVRISNDSGSTLNRGDILGIDGVSILPDVDENKFEWEPILSGVAPTSTHHGQFVVVTKSLRDGQIGWAQVDGLAVVRIADLSKPWQRADVDTSDATQLILTPNGSAQILWKAGSVEQVGNLTTHSGDTIVTQGGDSFADHKNHNWALVRLGLHRGVTCIGKADSEITIDSSGTVSLWTDAGDSGDNVTAELDWMHGDENVSSGKEVLVAWFPDESLWRIVGAECE
jgi:hypothetical protein